jgi:hypothetical protein
MADEEQAASAPLPPHVHTITHEQLIDRSSPDVVLVFDVKPRVPYPEETALAKDGEVSV